MKKILCLLLLVSIVFAQVDIERKNIVISIGENGNAEIKEEIIIEPNEESVKIFEKLAERGETDFEVWKTLVPNLEKSVKTTATPLVSGKKTKFTENVYEYKIIMNYEAKNIAELSSSQGRIENWKLQNNRLSFYDTSENKLVIPEGVSITLSLEDTRKDKTVSISEYFDVSPEGIAKGPYMQDNNRIVYFINGPAFTENFRIIYKIEKQITETVGTRNITNFFAENPLYVIMLIALIVLIVIFRKQVISLAGETFISEEDIILPRKKSEK